jgi:hypothetical protein
MNETKKQSVNRCVAPKSLADLRFGQAIHKKLTKRKNIQLQKRYTALCARTHTHEVNKTCQTRKNLLLTCNHRKGCRQKRGKETTHRKAEDMMRDMTPACLMNLLKQEECVSTGVLPVQ